MGNVHFKRDQYNWGDSFYLYDEFGTRKYRVKSSVLLWNRKFVIYDLDKNVLVEIKNEPKSLLKKKFYIMIGGQQVTAITKEIAFPPKYTMEGLNWQFEGFMRHDFRITENGTAVMAVTEESTSWGRHPVLTFSDAVDELTAVAVAMTIGYVVYAEDCEKSANYL